MNSEQMRTQAPVIPGLLRGKVVIITGASRGIGAETARAFSRAGAPSSWRRAILRRWAAQVGNDEAPWRA